MPEHEEYTNGSARLLCMNYIVRIIPTAKCAKFRLRFALLAFIAGIKGVSAGQGGAGRERRRAGERGDLRSLILGAWGEELGLLSTRITATASFYILKLTNC